MATLSSPMPIKRQPRTRTRKQSPLANNDLLHIIPEEDESRRSLSSSRASSPLSGSPSLDQKELKNKRRHMNLSGLPNDLTLYVDPFPSLCDDPFRLILPDESYNFPRPPVAICSPSSDEDRIFGSPIPSCSTSSSPSTGSTGLPVTPSSSDDETFLPPPSQPIPARRVTIRPLTITKVNSSLPSTLADTQCQSDNESDYEWYGKELSKVVTLHPPLPVAFPHPMQARPESLPPSVWDDLPPSPSPRRASLDHGLIPSQPHPSSQLDPSYPRRRKSHRHSSSAPIPPVPPIPAHFRSLSSSSVETNRQTEVRQLKRPKHLSLRRPPPRSSVPADFSLFDDELDIFGCYAEGGPLSSASSGSHYSQVEESEIHLDSLDFEFDLDVGGPSQLTLSLPTSPLDFEAEIATGLQELQLSNDAHQTTAAQEVADIQAIAPWLSMEEHLPVDPVHALKSRWSSSTLSSIREEDKRRTSKLKMYFTPSKRRGSKVSSGTSSRWSPGYSPSTFSRFKQQQQRRESDVMGGGFISLISPATPKTPYSPYSPSTGIHRRGSTSSHSVGGRSDAGSVESGSSTSSSGLRRKPIPVEMFLRA